MLQHGKRPAAFTFKLLLNEKETRPRSWRKEKCCVVLLQEPEFSSNTHIPAGLVYHSQSLHHTVCTHTEGLHYRFHQNTFTRFTLSVVQEKII